VQRPVREAATPSGVTASPRSWSIDRWLVTLLLCAPLLGLLGVLVAEVVPDGRIASHLVQAEAEGILDRVERDPSPLATTTDHYSECVAATVGLGDLPGQDLFTRTMRAPAYYGCEQAVDKLTSFRDSGRLPPGWPYLRYWHGYTVLTRPAIAILGLAGTRWVGFAVLVSAIAAMTLPVKSRFGPVAATALVAPALLTTDMIVGGLTFQQALGMSTAWIGGALTLALVARHPSWCTAALAGALGGVINAYVDLMTTTPGAMAITSVGATLGWLASRRPAAAAWRVTVAAVVGWTGGLVWMWATKWVFAALALGLDDVVDDVRRQIEFRLSGGYEGVTATRSRGLTDNLAEWWNQPLTPWLVAALLILLGIVAVRARLGRPPWSAVAASAAIVAVPTAGWYAVLNNHTQIHFWMVYRSIPLAIGGIVALVIAAVPPRTTHPDSLTTEDDTPVAIAVGEAGSPDG
jgi:hypothetical protein